MALVDYSDSEASDSENEKITTAPTAPPKSTPTPSGNPKPQPRSIVDRSNPRKIRVALDLKPESADGEEDNGPVRKKLRIGGGGGGGAFAGFNSLLPPPKRPNASASASAEKGKALGGGSARRVFSLKTGAAPGFDREADEEMKRDMVFEKLGSGENGEEDDETIPKAGSLRREEGDSNAPGEDVKSAEKKPEEVVLKGNPMMFKPLSVARPGQRKKKAAAAATIIPSPVKESKEVRVGETATERQPVTQSQSQLQSQSQAQKPTGHPPASKPKVSLFSLSSEEAATPEPSTTSHISASTYEPLVYTANDDAEVPAAGPMPESESASTTTTQAPTTKAPAAPSEQTLGYIADDLNLSRSQRRQLFGRNADPSKSRILHFDTDAEYAANQEMVQKDLAAVQHNPVRAIAPGKHTLQQLVNAASTQKEALEESFAAGKRNKKEAGARYGW
ncbi:mitotic checkpoint regulator, MAD2B-interacting-domain-containing protein [Aspergillus egyptiacus]|nr:mitotic checkpoint regulator, MAD2B-interacting-domain-containing protein [Aspergillus egyptiacus]